MKWWHFVIMDTTVENIINYFSDYDCKKCSHYESCINKISSLEDLSVYRLTQLMMKHSDCYVYGFKKV